MNAAAPEKFGFNTVFDASGDVSFQAPRPKRLFSLEDVNALKREAFAEGEQMATASLAGMQAQALAEIAAACGQALPRLAEVAHNHRVESARLAMACGRAIAGAALDRFPDAVLRAALDALAREIESAPRLVITADPQLAKSLRETLTEVVQACGYAGAVQVRDDVAQAANAFTLDFGDGQAAYDPEAASQRVSEALEAALAAEGLHAEPLTPGSES